MYAIMNKVAEIKHLSVGFQSATALVSAVDDVNFSLKSGETVALLGESGCGKSLTSLAIMRLLPADGVYGFNSEVNIAGLSLLDLPERIMRSLRGRRLAMIFQEPMTALNPVLTIGEQLAESIRVHQHLNKTDLNARMLALLNDVEMPQPALRLRQYPHQLSGGQKQRVVIAMALACHPEVLIADEPTTALDVTIQAQVLDLLKKLQNQYQMSILLITHDLGVVKAMAHTVCVMYAGQLVESSPVEKFFSAPLHPYAQQLFISLPSFKKRGQRLKTLTGSVPALGVHIPGCRFHPRCAHAFAPCSTVEPVLQVLNPEQQVRCHLYPSHSQPPALPDVQEDWKKLHPSSETLLSVEQLVVEFAPRRLFKTSSQVYKAVDGISFKLQKGRTLALVGESGCGKTTLSRALMGLLPIRSGNVFFYDKNVRMLNAKGLRDFRKRVQIIFQDPYSSMNPRMMIEDILAEGMKVQKINAAQIRARQYELLDQVNLARNSLRRYPHQFSGGQRQRICIARALATKPELLICDEPTSALDMSVQAQILNLLKSLQQELGLSYLFITHNMEVVSYIADDVLVMRNGLAVEQGQCETLLKNPKEAYTKQLLDSVLEV